MKIGGLQKFSLLDYPGYLSAIVFTHGCSFRCQFCYNPMLVWPKPDKFKQKGRFPEIAEDDLFVFLKDRAGKIDAVVVTGGEPTIQADLPEFLAKIKALDYLVKLDTNGTNPEMVKGLIESKLVDYLAMDIKAPAAKYDQVAGIKVGIAKIKDSIKIIMESGLPYEFRTTMVPGLHEPADLAGMGKLIKGADKWFIQQFKSDTDLLDEKLQGVKPFPWEQIEFLRQAGEGWVKKCEIR